jgi:hypothetical protein
MSERKETNPKDQAATDRIDLSLFPDTAVAYGALAMTEGHLKYGGYNFRPAGVQASVYVAACRRHLAKWYNGEDVDADTKVPHLANALACIAILIDSIECKNMNDDRPPTCDLAKLMDGQREIVRHLQDMHRDGPGRFRAELASNA